METLDFYCKGFKSVTDTGTFTGFASTYEKDLVNDVIMPGAFAMAINNQGSGVPVLWNHDTGSPIGRAKISDSKAGLIANGSLFLKVPAAQTTYELMQNDVVKGLSVGFSIDDPNAVSYDSDGTRYIRSLHLFEISCVCFPANEGARITAVKSLSQVEKYLRSERARIQKSAAAVDDAMVSQLQEIHKHILALLDDGEDDSIPDPEEDFMLQLAGFANELKALASA